MPAYTSDVNDIHFPAIRLIGYFADANAKFFRQFFIQHLLSEFISIIDADCDHKIFCKLTISEMLQDEQMVGAREIS